MSLKIMGIDPGFNGGIAILVLSKHDSHDVITHDIIPMPVVETDIGNELDYQRIFDLIKWCDSIFVEKAQPMPKNGAKQAFKYGGGFFAIRCMIELAMKRVTYVNPQEWKNKMLKGMDKSKKRNSIVRAKQLHPQISLVPKGCEKEHDGMAEAVLIAEYGLQIERGK